MTMAIMNERGTSQMGHLGASWREADQQLREIAARRAALDAHEARWIVVARASDCALPRR
jgi:hypothetical protein